MKVSGRRRFRAPPMTGGCRRRRLPVRSTGNSFASASGSGPRTRRRAARSCAGGRCGPGQRASSLDAVGKSNRAKLKAAREEVREVRRTAKRAVALEREAARLGRLLAEAGVDARKRSTVVSLRMENAALKSEVRRLRDRVAALEARNEELRSSRSSMSKSMFGSKSEKRRGEASKRKRGQQPGAPQWHSVK